MQTGEGGLRLYVNFHRNQMNLYGKGIPKKSVERCKTKNRPNFVLQNFCIVDYCLNF